MGQTASGIRYPELVGVTADVPRDMKALAEDVDDRIYIIGEVRWLALGAPPSSRWLACSGQEISRTTYVKLWNAIRMGHAGTAGDPAPYGNGDGTTTFTIPDLRGRGAVAPGAAVGGGVEASPPNRLVGTKWGVNAVVLSAAQMQHGHTTVDHYHSLDGNGGTADHTHGFSVGSAEPGYGTTGVQSLAGGPLGIARSGHAHSVAGGTVGSDRPLTLGGRTANAIGNLWTYGVDFSDPYAGAPSAAVDNAQPSLAIPAFIFAGA